MGALDARMLDAWDARTPGSSEARTCILGALDDLVDAVVTTFHWCSWHWPGP